MFVRNRQTCVSAMGLGHRVVGDCRGRGLSHLLGSVTAGGGHPFGNRFEGRGAEPRQRGLGFGNGSGQLSALHVPFMYSLRTVFIGPNGLRAGWRLLIFVAMLVPLYFGTDPIIVLALQTLRHEISTPVGVLVVFSITLAALFLATGIMARIEGRSISDYGLPWRRALCGQFWQGAAISFVSLTALLFVLRFAGAFSFGSLALHGADIWKYGVLWALAFFVGVLTEDFLYRGYL